MSVKRIKINADEKSIIKSFLEFTKSIHKLRNKEMELLAEILYKNHTEKGNFKREEDRWNKVFSYESKLEYKDNLDIQDHTLQNLLSSLRRNKVIIDGRVKQGFIPNLNEDKFFLVLEWTKS